MKEILEALAEKYNKHDGELESKLRGLLVGNGVNYWDYIHLDTLQSIQHQRTDLDDEMIFIVYHQITELYFLLIKSELKKLTDPVRKEYLDKSFWLRRIGRVIHNIDKLIYSFDVLSPDASNEAENYFDNAEFLQFRLALTPASGFQTISLREIEIMSTRLRNLVHTKVRTSMHNEYDLASLYEHLYWKSGGRLDDGSGRLHAELDKVRTLEEFEKKYDAYLLGFAQEYEQRNLDYIYSVMEFEGEEAEAMEALRADAQVAALLKQYSYKLNSHWKENHFGIIRKHMEAMGHGTGGTNWKEFLPPAKQLLDFFPNIPID